jgi:hypothetical protein
MRWEGLAKKKMILCLGRTDRVEGNQRGFGTPVSAVKEMEKLDEKDDLEKRSH